MRFTPQQALKNVEVQLERAGMGNVDASMFYAMRFVLAFGLGGFLAFVFWASPTPQPFGRSVMIVLGATLVGFFMPQMYVTSKMQRRQNEIRKAMPDALDLLTICVEAGLGFDAAMAKVAEKWDNELSLAFGRAIREIQLGKTRRDALRDMADRIGLPEMTSFVAAIIQSEQLGVSMANVLRIQSEQMRIKRRQRAEEEAHKAPIKMIIPMGLLIFPSLLILLLTPAGLIFVRLFSDFM
jgi:tight adherence protein C